MKNCIIILTFLAALIIGCGGDKSWENAIEQNTIEAYEKYMTENPKGVYFNTAKIKFDSLKVAAMETAWKNATKEHKLKTFESFLAEYPESPHVEQAKDLMKMIKKSNYRKEELKAWKIAKEKHTIKDYKEFLESFYDGEHKIYAWENIFKLENEHFFDKYNVVIYFFNQLDQEGLEVEEVFSNFTPDSLMYNSTYLNSPYTKKMFDEDGSGSNTISNMLYSGKKFLLGLYGDPESEWDVSFKIKDTGIELVYSPSELYLTYYKFVWKYNVKNELEIISLEIWFEGDV